MSSLDTQTLDTQTHPGQSSDRISRRSFLKKNGQAVVFLSIATRLLPASALVQKDSIRFYRVQFQNWAKTITVDNLLATTINSEDDAEAVVQWAMEQGYQVRPCGSMHNWSPLVITADTTKNNKVLLVVLSGMTACHMDTCYSDYGIVTAQAGIRMETLCQYLAEQPSPLGDPTGYAIESLPAVGNITLAGALAIGGHGTGVPHNHEDQPYGFGSLSNTVLSVRAIVWDQETSRYKVRTFYRDDEDTDVVLTHLGHLLVTTVTLQVVPNFSLRCRSYTNISWEKLFHKDPLNNPFTIQNLLEQHGRINVIWFPYTQRPWLKIWDKTPVRPTGSMPTKAPYNYAFADNPSPRLVRLLGNIVSFTSRLIPLASKFQYTIMRRALKGSIRDLWGPAWHTLLYVRPTTVPASAAGYAIHLPRSKVQSCLYDVTAKIVQLQQQYARKRIYPSAGPLEIRITGLEDSSGLTSLKHDARPPALSPLTRSSEPSITREPVDTAVWLDLLTLPSTVNDRALGRANAFYVDMEAWLFGQYPASQIRVEWSKGWAYTDDEGAWSNKEVLTKTIPETFSQTPRSFHQTIEKIREMDPYNIFSNDFLDTLFQTTTNS